MGSMNTGIINSMEELQSFLRLGLSGNVDGPIDYEIEKFIRGEMYHIDGLFYNGQVKLCWPSKYINTCVDFKSNSFLGSYALRKDNPMTEALQSLVEPILMALDRSSSYSFHIEVWDMQPNVPFTKDEEIPRLEVRGSLHRTILNSCSDLLFARPRVARVVREYQQLLYNS
jgi:hypothetical protein